MSRTIRRTGDKKRNKSGRSHFVENYITDYPEEWFGVKGKVKGWGGLPTIWKEGREYDKGFHKFHGDTKRGYGWSNHTYTRFRFEQRCRMKNKMEIQKWLNDNEYEVFTYQPGCLSWER